MKGQGWDAKFVYNIQTQTPSSLDGSMKFVSNSAYFLVPAIPIGMFATGMGTKDTNLRINSIQMGIGIVASGLISFGLKELIQRDRPFSSHSNINNWGNESGYSMPSAHTSFAFSMATSLSLEYPKWYIIVPSYLWASSVAFSRMYLGAHYLTDILIGVLVGSASAVLGYYLFPKSAYNRLF